MYELDGDRVGSVRVRASVRVQKCTGSKVDIISTVFAKVSAINKGKNISHDET